MLCQKCQVWFQNGTGGWMYYHYWICKQYREKHLLTEPLLLEVFRIADNKLTFNFQNQYVQENRQCAHKLLLAAHQAMNCKDDDVPSQEEINTMKAATLMELFYVHEIVPPGPVATFCPVLLL